MSKTPTAEDFLQDHYEISYFYDDKTEQMVCFASDLQKAMIEFAKLQVIEELKKHVEHPTKPGYKRRDIIARIKELENE